MRYQHCSTPTRGSDRHRLSVTPAGPWSCRTVLRDRLRSRLSNQESRYEILSGSAIYCSSSISLASPCTCCPSDPMAARPPTSLASRTGGGSAALKLLRTDAPCGGWDTPWWSRGGSGGWAVRDVRKNRLAWLVSG
jgi:hypothetical protein